MKSSTENTFLTATLGKKLWKVSVDTSHTDQPVMVEVDGKEVYAGSFGELLYGAILILETLSVAAKTKFKMSVKPSDRTVAKLWSSFTIDIPYPRKKP